MELCKTLKEKLNLDKYTFLEPSAGFGSFVNALQKTFKEPKIEAIDLDPKSVKLFLL